MPEEKFKLPRSSYEELSKIVKAYGHFEEAASLDEVSKFIGIQNTVISGNSGFLLEVEILQPGAKKVLTSSGRELARALEHEMPDEIRTWWRRIVMESEFMSKLVSAVKIRKGMDETTLQSHIAYSAGQPKKPQVMTGARTVVDILRAAELIAEQDGKFTVLESNLSVPGFDKHDVSTPAVQAVQSPAPVVQQGVSSEDVPGRRPNVNINIEIKICCDAGALDTLGNQLRSLIAELQDTSQQGGDVIPDTDED